MHPSEIEMPAARLPPSAILLALLLTATTTTLYAQSYPTRAVRMIVPFAPGGNTDIIGRVYAPKMAEALGQQLIIDNRGGAGSTIGTELAAKAAPDGYTILMVSAAHTINPAMAKKLPYDSVRDKFNRAEIAKWIKVAREAGIQPE
jgi:tripartite-type tricarboxylate transporter receptor subunit TctC